MFSGAESALTGCTRSPTMFMDKTTDTLIPWPNPEATSMGPWQMLDRLLFQFGDEFRRRKPRMMQLCLHRDFGPWFAWRPPL